MAEKRCNHCGTDEAPASVPYIVHESAIARAERQIKRLWITVILLVVLLVGTNVAWLIYESQFETVEETITETYEVIQDGMGENDAVINGGDIENGTEN